MKALIYFLPALLLLVSCPDPYYVNDTEAPTAPPLEAPTDEALPTEEELSLQEINLRLEERRREMEARRAQTQTSVEQTSQYPTAAKVPGKEGFITSPYTGKTLDVRNLPSGKLVGDPDYPKSSKKFFYIP